MKVVGKKDGIMLEIPIPVGPCSVFSEGATNVLISAREAFDIMGQLRDALFEWSKLNDGMTIDEGNPC